MDNVALGVIWFAAVIVFLIIEGVTYQLVSIYLAAGAVGGLVMYILDFDFMPQMIVFLIVSVLLLILVRPISVKAMKNGGRLRTNTDSLIGKKVYITKTVDNIMDSGEGRVNGSDWSVRSDSGAVIAAGKTAVVERIEGVKLIVKEEE
ncbi:MAG TPA: NfeD family protein [Candidatus Ornithomonoglobus intestinigallinarum]|uniref:NfeD family protein n=1 Tax=Candidatus Ornithomonoglobus intestinigallinarum TaxID=2840894 RepID=A0A9D1KPH6_9FIRM|nr:NfeD family protein [Candidatus Ornithomonoglobus intestinigallinarum]